MLFDQGAYVQIDTNRCLNQQHNAVECSHCVSHCPGQALILHNHQIYLIQERCLGCGLCFADCPTQVFNSKQWDETTILTEVEGQRAKVTQVFCGYHETPYLSKEEKDKGAVQIPTCLGSISKGMWYELSLATAIELRLDECNQCPMKGCLERMKIAMQTALEWSNASGHNPDFSYIYTAEKARKKKKLQAASSGLRVTSRRDLFLSIMGRKPEEERRPLERKPDCPEEMKMKERENVLPEWQKRFEASYFRHYFPNEVPAYWPAVQMSTDCVNCGMCSRYCPSKALQIKINDGEAAHFFTSGYCLDCRICMLSCPTRSISRDRCLDPEPFAVRTIYKAPVAKCRICGAETITNDKDLCYWCKEEPPEEDLLSDVRKKLFGRLRQ